MAKGANRVHSPDCEGRFSEIRQLFYDAAFEWKYQKGSLLARVVTERDLKEVIEIAQRISDVPFNGLDNTHPRDPYFDSSVDPLRQAPSFKNFHHLMLVPFIFEGMRESLYTSRIMAGDILTALDSVQSGNFDPSIDRVLNSVEESLEGTFSIDELAQLLQTEALGFLYGNNQRGDRFGREQLQLLGQIAERDYTITGNSVNTIIIDAFARRHIKSESLLDNLRYFFSGTYSLDSELGVKMRDIMVPTHDGRDVIGLGGYYVEAQFGPGQSVQRDIVSSAPYKMILFKAEPGRQHYQPDGLPVMGISFFITHYEGRDTMLVAQIQDMRGERVPESTTPGLVALSLAEKLGAKMGFRQVTCYSSNSFGTPPNIKYAHPLRYHYPQDEVLAKIIHMNYDEPAEMLHWDKIRDPSARKHGAIMGYAKRL